MANYWAIAMGINQYECFQPLSYAQRDARVFHRFLVNEAGFPANQCVLLTDTSPAIDQNATVPSLETIQHYVKQVSDRLQPDDFLWFFFSGYGVRVEGRDYLMPIEGDPTQANTTGLAIDTLFATFQKAATKNVFVVLDMNRSQGTVAGEGVGAQTIDLARETGIATLLSCPPYQFSCETIALRQGLFTTALLEGLRHHGCVTLEQLAQYLSQRLPELSEHHWRPIQQPVAIIPSELRYELILPGKAVATVGTSPTGGGSGGSHSPQGYYYSGRLETAPHPAPMVILDRPSPNGSAHGATSQEAASDPVADEAFWRNFRLWASVIILALLLLVVWRLRGALVGGETPAPITPPNPTQPTDAGTAQPLSPPVTDNNANSGNDTNSGNNTSSGNNTNSNGGTNGQQPIESGGQDQTQSDNQQLIDPFNLTSPSPVTTQDFNTASPSPRTVNTGGSPLNAARALLTRPRASSRANQVSDFVEAINRARQVRPDQADYRLAQQDIDRWSQVILDMANGRAAQPNNGSAITAAQNLSSAIAAARLVPRDRAALYQSAQASIGQWSQQILNLANSRAALQDFNQAIQIARQIPRNTPTYNAAQQAIATWQPQVY